MTDPLLSLVFHYGYWGLFAAMSLGIAGVPIPDELLLTASGYLMSQGHMHLGWTMLAAISGSLVGMTLSYIIGSIFGRPLLTRYGRYLRLTPEKLERYERQFAKWGHVLVLIGYFVPGLRHVTALVIGMGRHRYPPFLAYAALGALVWTSTFELIGMALGDHWREITTILQHDMTVLLFALAGMILLIWTWRRSFAKRRTSD